MLPNELSAVGLFRIISIGQLLVVVVCISVLFSVESHAQNDIGCCVLPGIAQCLPVEDSTSRDECGAIGGDFRNQACTALTECQVVTGCCCGGPDGFAADVSNDVCLALNSSATPTVFHFSTQGQSCSDFCSVGSGGPGVGVGGTCLDQGGYWCAPGGSDGVELVSVSDTQGSDVCYDQPCRSVVRSCEEQGGYVCSQVQGCPTLSGWLDVAERCCFVPCVERTCGSIGGVVCDSTQHQCRTNDFSSLVSGLQTGRICCDACVLVSGCQSTTKSCTDGIDNNCDGRVDGASQFCSASLSGRVVNTQGQGVSGITIRGVGGLVQDVFTTISLADGSFSVSGVHTGRYTLEIISSQYRGSPVEAFVEDIGQVRDGIILNVQLRESGIITGVVRDETESPIEGATIFAGGRLVFSDSEGGYTLQDLETHRSVAVYAFKNGYRTADVHVVDFTQGQLEVVHNITLASYTCFPDISRPAITSLSPIKGVSHLRMSWTSGSCPATSVVIERCVGGPGECIQTQNPQFGQVLTLSDGSQRSWVDTDTGWDQDYTYRIGVKYNSLQDEYIYSHPLSVFTGNEQCKDVFTTNHFCIIDMPNRINGGFLCNERNVVVQAISDMTSRHINCYTRDNSLTCAQFFTGEGVVRSRCVPNIDCANNVIADPFGLYFTKEICEGSESPCYYDYSLSSIDTCLNCRFDMTCLDYRSKESCERNVCGVSFKGVSAYCEWKPAFSDSDLSIGTCIDASRSNTGDLCSLCGSQYNRVFSICTQEMCSALGDCHFTPSSSGNPPTCTSCETMSCYDYTDQDSCGASNLHRDALSNAVTGGADACGIGTCRWFLSSNPVGGYCGKDADVNDLDDCSQTEFSVGSGSIIDIIGRCRSDRDSPQTSVMMASTINPMMRDVRVTFNSVHRSWIDMTRSVKYVYFCIEPTDQLGSRCGRVQTDYDKAWYDETTRQFSITLDNLTVRPGQGGQEYTLSPGNNTIHFYGVGWSNNVELVKSHTFLVDLSGPSISMDYRVEPLPLSVGQIQRSNLLVFVTLDKPGSCSINVDGCDILGNCQDDPQPPVSITPQISSQYVTDHHRILNNLYDGHYEVIVNCIDVIGNRNVYREFIVVDGDPNIFNAQPHGPRDNPSLTLSVSTTDSVSCRWTTDINAEYTAIDPSHTMTRVREQNHYVHRYDMTLDDDRQYVYYVVCNYDPVSRGRIAVTLDRIAPQVELTDAIGNPFDFSRWQTSGLVYAHCSDEPIGGFGCKEVRYCLGVYEPFRSVNEKTNCIPDTPTVANTPIAITSPRRLCVVAEENQFNGMGGQLSEELCHDVLVDLYAPYLSIDSFPLITNQAGFMVSGSLIDVHYQSQSWNLVDSVAQRREFIESHNIVFRDMVLRGTASIRFDVESLGIASILFGYNSDQDSYMLSVDVTNIDTQYLHIQQLTGQTPPSTIGSIPIVIESGKQYPFVVEQKENTIVVRFGEYELSVDRQTRSGRIGARSVSVSSTPIGFEVKDIKVQDQSIPLRNRLFVERAGGVILLEEVENTFTIPLTLTNGTLIHGTPYTFAFYGRDQAGRTSNIIQRTIYYDIEGPNIHSLVLVPLDDQPSQDYVEVSRNAQLQVVVTDDFGDVDWVQGFIASKELSFVQDGQLWKANFTADNMYLGYHSVVIRAADSTGNIAEKEFVDAVLVDDRIDPLITLGFSDPYRVGTARPRFDVSTSDTATCDISYTDQQGQLREQRLIPNADQTVHYIDELGFSLRSIEGQDVRSLVDIECSGLGGRSVMRRVIVIVDRRGPIIGVRANDYDLYLSSYDRITKRYDVVTNTDRSLRVIADEPVQCRYDTRDVNYSQMQFSMENQNQDVYALTDQSSVFSLPIGSHQFYVSCSDAAGNIAQTTRSVIFDVDRFADAQIYNVTPQGPINVDPRIRFHTLRNLNCQVTLDGQSIPLSVSGSGPYVFESQPISGLQEQVYQFAVQCIDPNGNIQNFANSYQFLIDKRAPLLTITAPEPISTISDPSITVVGQSDSPGIIVITNQRVHVRESISSGEFSYEIPVKSGVNDIFIQVTDLAGNSVTRSVRVNRETLLPEVTFEGLLHGATQGQLSEISAVFTDSFGIPNSVGVSSVDITVRDEGGAVIPGSVDHEGSRIILRFTQPLTDGSYTALVTGKNTQGSVIAFDTTMFSVDTFSEPIRVFSPSTPIISTPLINVTGRVDYTNVLVWNILHVGQVRSTVPMMFEQFGTLTGSAGGINAIRLAFQNELGHVSQVSGSILLDYEAPVATIRLKDINGSISPSNRPTFVVTFSKPSYVISAFVEPQDPEQHPGVGRIDMESWDPDRLSVSHELTVASALQQEGAYQFGVQGRDHRGNTGVTYYFAFIYRLNPLTIELENPRDGVSPMQSFNLTITTNRPAQCRWQTYPNATFDESVPFMFTGGTEHRHPITLPAGGQQVPYYFICRDEMGNENNNTSDPVIISFDDQPPIIERLIAERAVSGVINQFPLATDILVDTDKDARCRYSQNPNSTFDAMLSFRNATMFSRTHSVSVGNLIDQQEYTYWVICESRAGVQSNPQSLSFFVDLTQSGDLRIISPEPNGYYSQTSIDIRVRTNKAVGGNSCQWGLSSDAINQPFSRREEGNRLHIVDGSVFSVGRNEVHVECLIEGEFFRASSSFVVDQTPPVFERIEHLNATSSTSRLEAEFFFRDDESGIDRYEYAIGLASVGLATSREQWSNVLDVQTTSSSRVLERGLDLEDMTTYYWTVRAMNRAGMWSDWYSSRGITVDVMVGTIDFEGPLFNDTPHDIWNGSGNQTFNDTFPPRAPSCFDGIRNQDETDVDCGGLICAPCSAGRACVYDEDCMSGLCTAEGVCAADDSVGQPGGSQPPIVTQPGDQQRPDQFVEQRGFFAWIRVNLLSILLFLIALLLVGGALGYLGYTRYKEKHPEQEDTIAQESFDMNYPQEETLPEGPLTPKERLRRALHAKIRDKNKRMISDDHRSLLAKFRDDSPKSDVASESKQPNESQKPIDRHDLSDKRTDASFTAESEQSMTNDVSDDSLRVSSGAGSNKGDSVDKSSIQGVSKRGVVESQTKKRINKGASASSGVSSSEGVFEKSSANSQSASEDKASRSGSKKSHEKQSTGTDDSFDKLRSIVKDTKNRKPIDDVLDHLVALNKEKHIQESKKDSSDSITALKKIARKK